MGFQFKGGSSSRSSGRVIASCNIGSRSVQAVADSFQSSPPGSEMMHVVRVEGLGKPTIFGAQKFCALMEMQNAIAEYFRSLGQIE